MAELSGNIKQAWQQTNLVQRVILMTVVLACVGAGALLLGWARTPHMGMLYRGLDPEEASAIVEKIRDTGIEYELTGGGTGINVPVDDIYQLRLQMAKDGLPQGGQKGYRLLDEAEFGSSPDKLRINYIRAVEGELAKTIQMIDIVTGARVHVVVPEGRLFSKKKKGASATVALRVKSGRRMGRGKAAAIVHMVAGAVEDLAPENVVVVANGEIVSSEEKGPMGGGGGSLFDYKTRIEERDAKKVQDMLIAALGPDRSSVSVSAVIDTVNKNKTTETYDPELKVVSKEEITTSSTTPGTGAGSTGDATREEVMSSEYMVTRTIDTTTTVPGTVSAYSVAVLVDLTPPPVPEGAEAPKTPPMTIKDIEDIARNAIGLKESDSLSVKETHFASAADLTLEVPEEGGGFTDPTFLLEMGRRFSLGILVIGALMALRMFRGPKQKIPAEASQAPVSQLAGQSGQAEALLPGDANPDALRSQITNALQNNPEEVKKLFLHWVESKQEIA